MLEVDGIEVRYGRVSAVRQLSLRVAAGELVALIGHNGAGKTTTLRAIAGIEPLFGGEIRFEGESITGMPPELVRRRGIGLVPEGRRLFVTLSVAENLRLGATVLEPGVDLDGAIERAIEPFPALRRYFSSPASRLSGGEQQQVAIARALVARPKLLMLDEPSLGLAPRVVESVFAAVEALRASGITTLLVEQHALKAIEAADRAYVITAGGGIAFEGPAAELRNNPDLHVAYLGGA